MLRAANAVVKLRALQLGPDIVWAVGKVLVGHESHFMSCLIAEKKQCLWTVCLLH